MNYMDIVNLHNSELNRPDKVSMTAQWVEDTYRDVMSRRKFSWLYGVSQITTVVNQYIYSLPPDFYSLVEVMFRNGTTNSWAMNVLTEGEFNKIYPNVLEETAGMPEDACVTSNVDADYVPYNELVVAPPPDAATYTMDMRYELVTPALGNGITPVIPARYHSVLYFGSLRRGFLNLREYEAADVWKKQYEETIAKMINDDSYVTPRNAVMQPFRGSPGTYPPSYWKKYEIGGIR